MENAGHLCHNILNLLGLKLRIIVKSCSLIEGVVELGRTSSYFEFYMLCITLTFYLVYMCTSGQELLIVVHRILDEHGQWGSNFHSISDVYSYFSFRTSNCLLLNIGNSYNVIFKY